MSYSNSTQTYMRSAVKIGLRQQARPQDLFDLSTWLVLWKPVGKILLMILPVFLGIHMFVASAVTNIDQSLASIDNQRYELMDKNIELLARKAKLWSPLNMQQLAGEKLALFVDSGNQVGRFNRRTGSFIYR